MDQEKIGKIIKEIRKNNNLTQADLANKYNVTYQAVSKWENGKSLPDIVLLKQICKDAFFYHYLNNYPYQLLPMKHRLFYLLVKYRATLLLLLVYKLNKK